MEPLEKIIKIKSTPKQKKTFKELAISSFCNLIGYSILPICTYFVIDANCSTVTIYDSKVVEVKEVEVHVGGDSYIGLHDYEMRSEVKLDNYDAVICEGNFPVNLEIGDKLDVIEIAKSISCDKIVFYQKTER